MRGVPSRIELLTAAARNNAQWCDAVCSGHGLVTEFGPHAWICQERSPRYYPDVVTLSPDASAADVLAPVETAPADTSAGCTVKDSFAALDLTPGGFEVLFDARWLAATPSTGPVPDGWRVVSDADELTAWVAAAGLPGLFHAGLLDAPEVRFLARFDGAAPVAGAIAIEGAGVVGLSNVFGDEWRSVVSLAGQQFPGVPVVTYEHGDALTEAIRAGLTPIGPLRVWGAEVGAA